MGRFGRKKGKSWILNEKRKSIEKDITDGWERKTQSLYEVGDDHQELVSEKTGEKESNYLRGHDIIAPNESEDFQYYLSAGYYNPTIGRFLQEDTYRGDGLNLYAYCQSNPAAVVAPYIIGTMFLKRQEH